MKTAIIQAIALLAASVLCATALAQDSTEKRVQQLEDRLARVEGELSYWRTLALDREKETRELRELREAALDSRLENDVGKLTAALENRMDYYAGDGSVSTNTSLTISGVYMAQFIGFSRSGYTAPFSQQGQWLAFSRTDLNFDLRVRDDVRVFVQLEDARFFGEPQESFFQDNTFTGMHQSYVDMEDVFGSGLTLRVGRQEIDLWDGWFLSSGDGYRANVSYDSLRLFGQYGDDLELDFAYIAERESAPPFLLTTDDEDIDTFYGAATYKGFEGHELGGALFYRVIEGQRHMTALTHLEGRFGAFDYAANLAVQFGDIQAFGAYLALAYNFEIGDTAARWMLAYDVTSGSESTFGGGDNETFTPIFQAMLIYHGAIGISTGRNLHDAWTQLRLMPSPGWSIYFNVHAQWLYDRDDAWYGEILPVNAYAPGSGESFVGYDVNLVSFYALSENVILAANLSAFFPGDYVEAVADSHTVFYFGSQLEIRF